LPCPFLDFRVGFIACQEDAAEATHITRKKEPLLWFSHRRQKALFAVGFVTYVAKNLPPGAFQATIRL